MGRYGAATQPHLPSLSFAPVFSPISVPFFRVSGAVAAASATCRPWAGRRAAPRRPSHTLEPVGKVGCFSEFFFFAHRMCRGFWVGGCTGCCTSPPCTFCRLLGVWPHFAVALFSSRLAPCAGSVNRRVLGACSAACCRCRCAVIMYTLLSDTPPNFTVIRPFHRTLCALKVTRENRLFVFTPVCVPVYVMCVCVWSP